MVKPSPGKAFFKAKMHIYSVLYPMDCALDAIKPGEWTVLVTTNKASDHVCLKKEYCKGDVSFEFGFVSLDVQGDLVVVDAAEFRQLLSSGPAYEAAVALDAGEEDYGKEFVGLLASEERNIGWPPMSVLGRAEVMEAFDLVKRYEANIPPNVAQRRDSTMAERREQREAFLARQ